MARGTAMPVGTERISNNGYLYRKQENGCWELVHRLIAEEKISRKLKSNEYAAFLDGDKTNFEPDNIIVQIYGRTSTRRKLAQVEARIAELTATRDELKQRLQVQQELSS